MQKMTRTNIGRTRRNAVPHSKEYAKLKRDGAFTVHFPPRIEKNREHSLHRFSKPGILDTFVTKKEI